MGDFPRREIVPREGNRRDVDFCRNVRMMSSTLVQETWHTWCLPCRLSVCKMSGDFFCSGKSKYVERVIMYQFLQLLHKIQHGIRKIEKTTNRPTVNRHFWCTSRITMDVGEKRLFFSVQSSLCNLWFNNLILDYYNKIIWTINEESWQKGKSVIFLGR